ncbi:MAG: 4Fe-4S dicluster domain-containing protein [Myxococcota bacterium]
MPPRAFTLDAWYLAPIALTDRLRAGTLWALLLGVGTVTLAVPWWMASRKARARVAEVDASRCNACTQCYQDCPYNAIQMVPRTDGKRFETQAEIDPSRCVGCGICAGSCNTGGIGLPWMPVVDQRQRIDGWLREVTETEEAPLLALVCSSSAGGTLELDLESG